MSLKVVKRISFQRSSIQHPNLLCNSRVLCSNIYHYHHKPLYALKKMNNVLYVYFKGCSSWKDYVTSIDIRSYKVEGELINIHNGYFDLFKKHEMEIEQRICGMLDNDDISHLVYCGHSAGGALSQIAALFLHHRLQLPNINEHCYTFGAPKSADQSCLHALQHVVGDRFVRVEMYNDIVPLLPIHPSFQHGGLPLVLRNNHVYDMYGADADVKGCEFFGHYHQDMVDFIKDMRDNELLNKEDILKMIDGHKCDTYMTSLREYLDHCN